MARRREVIHRRRRGGGVVVDHCRVAEPGVAVERSGVDVCIFLTPALATDDPYSEYRNDGNTSKSGGSIPGDGADAGAIVWNSRGRSKARGRACGVTSGLGSAGDGELLRGKVRGD